MFLIDFVAGRSIFEGEIPDYSTGLERYVQWPHELDMKYIGGASFGKADF